MKKLFLMLVMVFTMNVCIFADDTNYTETANIEKYDINVNMRRLCTYLDLSVDQMDGMENVEIELHNDLMFAAVETTKEHRAAVTKNAISKHIKHVRYILNDKQYKKYLLVLNVTLVNRGII